MKRRKIQLEGMDALSRRQGLALLKAAMSGRFSLSGQEYQTLLDACDILGTALVRAGEDQSYIEILLTNP
jgi:hypothetical protein